MTIIDYPEAVPIRVPWRALAALLLIALGLAFAHGTIWEPRTFEVYAPWQWTGSHEPPSPLLIGQTPVGPDSVLFTFGSGQLPDSALIVLGHLRVVPVNASKRPPLTVIYYREVNE